MTGKEFARRLERTGWHLLRINGSHHLYEKHGRQEKISVPVHGNRELKKGLLRHLEKVASGGAE